MEFRKLPRVVRRKIRKLCPRPVRIGKDAQPFSVRMQDRHLKLRSSEKFPFVQLQIFHDLRQERSRSVEKDRTLKPGMNLLGDSRAAGHFRTLEYDWCKPRLREIESCDEPVVPTANDDNAFAIVRHQRFHSLRIFCAAFNPGAPMMPPPGCVAEPHMYRLRIGVRYCAHPGTGRRKNNCSSESSP